MCLCRQVIATVLVIYLIVFSADSEAVETLFPPISYSIEKQDVTVTNTYARTKTTHNSWVTSNGSICSSQCLVTAHVSKFTQEWVHSVDPQNRTGVCLTNEGSALATNITLPAGRWCLKGAGSSRVDVPGSQGPFVTMVGTHGSVLEVENMHIHGFTANVGSAISVWYAELRVRNSRFSQNNGTNANENNCGPAASSSCGGGAIYALDSEGVSIDKSSFEGNMQDGSEIFGGGALYLMFTKNKTTDVRVMVSSTEFVHNRVLQQTAGGGAVVFNFDAGMPPVGTQVSFVDSPFRSNVAGSAGGGAVWFSLTTPVQTSLNMTFSGCEFSSNNITSPAAYGGPYGGAVLISTGTKGQMTNHKFEFDRCNFVNNSVPYKFDLARTPQNQGCGGAVAIVVSFNGACVANSYLFNACTFEGNMAALYGAAVFYSRGLWSSLQSDGPYIGTSDRDLHAFTNCDFISNGLARSLPWTAASGGFTGGTGGAVATNYISPPDVDLQSGDITSGVVWVYDGCRFERNFASNGAGGIWLSFAYSNMTTRNSTFLVTNSRYTQAQPGCGPGWIYTNAW